MCGRFANVAKKKKLLLEFDIAEVVKDIQERFNIAPGDEIAAVIRQSNQNSLTSGEWGMELPFSPYRQVINTRAESLNEKKFFHNLYKAHRCLIPSDGFYEWSTIGKEKVPYFIRLQSEKSFGMAGIWSHYTDKNQQKKICISIITTAANDLIKPLHERMPLIIAKENYLQWLDIENGITPDELLKSYDSDLMKMFEVSPLVNKVGLQSPGMIKPVEHWTLF